MAVMGKSILPFLVVLTALLAVKAVAESTSGTPELLLPSEGSLSLEAGSIHYCNWCAGILSRCPSGHICRRMAHDPPHDRCVGVCEEHDHVQLSAADALAAVSGPNISRPLERRSEEDLRRNAFGGCLSCLVSGCLQCVSPCRPGQIEECGLCVAAGCGSCVPACARVIIRRQSPALGAPALPAPNGGNNLLRLDHYVVSAKGGTVWFWAYVAWGNTNVSVRTKWNGTGGKMLFKVDATSAQEYVDVPSDPANDAHIVRQWAGGHIIATNVGDVDVDMWVW